MARKLIRERIFVYIIVLLCFSPVIIVFAKGNFNTVVESQYLNGLITACGVFVAFICASTITKAQELDNIDIRLSRLSLLTFIAAVFKLAVQLELGLPATLTELGLFSSSINLCAFATWSIVHTLLRKGQSSSSR